MKIALLQDDFPPHNEGGAGAIAYRLARGFVDRGHEVLVVTAVRQQKDAGTFDVDGMRVVRIRSDYHARFRAYVSLYNPRMLRALEQVLKGFAPDVVHAHSLHTHLSYYSLVLARKYAGSVYLTEHDAMSFYFGKLPSETNQSLTVDSDFVSGIRSFFDQARTHRLRFNPLRNLLIRRIIRANVDRSIAVSFALESALKRNGMENTTVIHNGIDVRDWERPQRTDDIASRLRIGNRAIFFGGRLSGAKGALNILEALANVRKTVPEVQLVIVGRHDSYADRMHEVAKRLGVEDHLIWAGWISGDELRAIYYSTALVAVPSLYLDPFPTVNLEAFACRVPVIATCFGGSREVVEDSVNGYVVNPLNIEALSQKITDLLVHDEKRHTFGEAGYELVRKEFSLAQQLVQYEKLFQSRIVR